MRLIIWPYKMASRSARVLAEELGCIRVRSNGNYRARNEDVIINWGNSTNPIWGITAVNSGATIVNTPFNTRRSIDKLVSFDLLRRHDVRVPDYTQDLAVALEWLYGRNKVLSRATLTGHSGAGIELHGVYGDTALPFVPLYVKYIRKTTEYRVHVFNDVVISISEKRLRNGARELPNYNKYIRSHNHGWVYTRLDYDGRAVRPSIVDEALKAVRALGLSFGAVDIIIGRDDQLPYVLEVNTAPGLEGQTLEAYARAIRDLE